MNRHPEELPSDDRLDVTDAELREADALLQQLPAASVPPLRPEWIEAVVAAAAAAPRAMPPRRGGWRRWWAAAAAVVGVHGLASAMAVTSVGVASVAAVLVWSAGRDSNRTMPFPLALDVLVHPEQGEEALRSALGQVFRRVEAVVRELRALQGSAGTPPELAHAATAGLARLHAEASGAQAATIGPVDDSLAMSLAILKDAARDATTRREHLDRCVALASSGLAAVSAIPACPEAAAADRRIYVERLVGSTRQ